MRAKVKTSSKKHAHLLVFVGALIVFLTFIIKDGFRERWKETAETIDRAQYLYTIRDDIRQVKIGPSDLGSYERRPGDPLLRPLDAYNSFWIELRATQNILTKDEVSLANIVILVVTLPEDDPNRHEAANIHDDLNSLRSQVLAAETAAMGKLPYLVDPNPKQKQDVLAAAGEQGWIAASNRLDLRVQKLAIVVLHKAEELRRENDYYSNRAWWISALLFGLGLGLGLLGKVYGVPEAAGSE